MMGPRVVGVDLGAVRVTRDPESELVVFGLGSCVAVCVWEPIGQLAAMAHVVLPSSPGDGRLSGKYADRAIPFLVQLVERGGGNPWRAQWKIAGGANVLRHAGLPAIGERNVDAVRSALRALDLPISAEDTGGQSGRTVRLSVRDGTLRVRYTSGGERLL